MNENKKIIYQEDLRGICRAIAPNEYDEHFLRDVEKELLLGFEFIRKYPKMVTIFGSARVEATKPYYEKIKELSYRLVKETGVTVATGGGPGVMEAASHGAYEADKSKSIAFGIELPHEQSINPYVSEYQNFRFFFTRKVMMAYTADAFIACPGGYGTFDEIFEMLTLQQTHKSNRAPIILFGVDYWQPIFNFITETLEGKGFIDSRDADLFLMTDSVDEIIELFKRLDIKG
jgi:uncharacterized protein (TIGR00730 family)